MGAYEISISGKPIVGWASNKNPISAVKDFIIYVKETNDPVIKGLLGIMAEEIKHKRLDGREYVGGTSLDIQDCLKDSEFLLARILLDCSSHGTPKMCYVKPQLNNIAWYIATEEDGKDSFHNWLMAERRYVRNGLEHLERVLQEEKSQAVA